MTKYYEMEVDFKRNNKSWEPLGESYPLMHKAVEHMIDLDLSFPTRIVKVTRQVVLAEKYERQIRKRQRVSKEK